MSLQGVLCTVGKNVRTLIEKRIPPLIFLCTGKKKDNINKYQRKKRSATNMMNDTRRKENRALKPGNII